MVIATSHALSSQQLSTHSAVCSPVGCCDSKYTISIHYYYSSQTQSLAAILSSTDHKKLSEAALMVVVAIDTQLPTLIINPEILLTIQTCYHKSYNKRRFIFKAWRVLVDSGITRVGVTRRAVTDGVTLFFLRT